MAISQSTRHSKGGESHDQDDRKPLRGALRRLGLWSSESDAAPEGPQTPIPAARTVRYEGDGERHNLKFLQRYLRLGDAMVSLPTPPSSVSLPPFPASKSSSTAPVMALAAASPAKCTSTVNFEKS